MRGVETSARVSVVIPCHNGSRYLREAIESVLIQGSPIREIVVIDDGSTDGSHEIAESIAGVVVYRQPRLGVSAARNAGLRRTTGAFVVFHDADDILLPGAVATGLRAFAGHPECGFVYGLSSQIDADGVPRMTRAPEPVVNASYETILSGSVPVPPSCVLFRRDALETVGGFRADQALAEDLDLYLRVAQRFPVHCHAEVVAAYRWHGANASGKSPSRTLRATVLTLDRQRPSIRAYPQLLYALHEGKRYFSEVFGEPAAVEMIENLRAGDVFGSVTILALVLRYSPRGLLAAMLHYCGWLRTLRRLGRR